MSFPAFFPGLWVAIRSFVVLSGIAVFTLYLVTAREDMLSRQKFFDDMAQVHVIPPKSLPKQSQESVDLAMMMFGIDLPTAAKKPVFRQSIKDRGLTTRGAFLEKAIVEVGPAAFSSWGLLGSTLAHEVEIHCQQNFLFIYVMDLVGLDGTGEAERQAYDHELAHAHRFGLAAEDQALISDTKLYYYPDNESVSEDFSLTIRNWMAANLLKTTKTF